MRALLVSLALVVSMAAAARAAAPASQPYADDPAVVKLLADLPPGQALLLPAVKHVDEAGQPIKGEGRLSNPYSRDYTNKMVYAADRQTAIYEGGNHGEGRTCDAWEYHLGSNTWIRLAAPDGGDQGAVSRATGAIRAMKNNLTIKSSSHNHSRIYRALLK